MSLTSIEAGVILFLIEHSSASDKEKLEALYNLETLLDPQTHGSLIVTIRKMREKLTRQERDEETFDGFRFEFILTNGENTIKWLRSRFQEAKAREDAKTIAELILPVVKLFEKTVNRRLLFVENSTFELLFSIGSELEQLKKELEKELVCVLRRSPN